MFGRRGKLLCEMIASLSTCFSSCPSIPCIWRTSLTNQQLCLKLEGKPMPSTLTITPSSRPFFFFFFFPLFPLHSWIVEWSTALLRNTVHFLVSIATSIRLMKAGQSFVGKIIMPLTLLSPSSAPTFSYCLWWDSVNRVSYTQMAVKLWPWWELQQKETARLEEEAGACTLLFSGGLPDHYGCCEHPISKASLPWQWQFLPTGRQRKSGKLEETGQGGLFLPMCSLCASSGFLSAFSGEHQPGNTSPTWYRTFPPTGATESSFQFSHHLQAQLPWYQLPLTGTPFSKSGWQPRGAPSSELRVGSISWATTPPQRGVAC